MSAAVLLALPVMASAQMCPVLSAFVSNGSLPAIGGVEARCSVSRVLGAGRSEDCFWRFPLRSDTARRHFESLEAELHLCSDAELEIAASEVNHPDSFDQVSGRLRGIPLSLSLKDKGGLSQTLVVLRRQVP